MPKGEKRLQDLTNAQFMHLIVIKLHSRYKNGVNWLCKCVCGNYIVVKASKLRRGSVISCGCIKKIKHSHNFKDLSGKLFNKLLAQSNAYTNEKGTTYWNCLCECGNTTIVRSYELTSGGTKSCGCINHKTQSNSHSWTGYGEISGDMWYTISNNAKKRKIPFEINISDAWSKFESQNKKSALSGTELIFKKSNKFETTASLDRIDSGKKYTTDNIWWIHKDENKLKWNLSLLELLYWCDLITNKCKSDYKLIVPYTRQNNNWCGFGQISGDYYSTTKRGAKYRNFEFSITIENMWDLFLKQNGQCSITKIPIFLKYEKNVEQTASLDRIDNSQGYTVENIQWVHKTINRMKCAFNQQYFILVCNNIHNYNIGIAND